MTRLFHVSDVHFGAEDPDALAWFAGLVAREKPDAVVMTGDLTMRAKKSEFDHGAAWLQSLGVPVTVEVGNHDLPYYFDPVGRLLHPYRRYLAMEQMIERPLHLEDVAIVPLKTTARAQWRLNWSKGYVSDRALAETLALVRRVPPGRLIFVAAHHPLIEAHTRSTGHTRHGRQALEALAEARVHAVLSGHVHDPFDIPYDHDGWTVRLIGAGTLSKRTRASPPAFNEICVEPDRFETLLRTMTPEPKVSLSETVEAGAAI
jgi:3',5'-cyclic AMP phosphodiesterase CpdA